jgi:hypothetical protein
VAAEVQSGSAQVREGFAAVAITAGQAVYFDASSKAYLSQNNLTGAKTITGIALNGAGIGQPVQVATIGSMTLGASSGLVKGAIIAVSATAGLLCPNTDLIAGQDLIIVGWATSNSQLQLAGPNGITGVTL